MKAANGAFLRQSGFGPSLVEGSERPIVRHVSVFIIGDRPLASGGVGGLRLGVCGGGRLLGYGILLRRNPIFTDRNLSPPSSGVAR